MWDKVTIDEGQMKHKVAGSQDDPKTRQCELTSLIARAILSSQAKDTTLDKVTTNKVRTRTGTL